MQIDVDVPEELLERIPEAIPKDTVPNLIAVAFAEWVAWLDGSFRPMTISELEMRRIFELYDRIRLTKPPPLSAWEKCWNCPWVGPAT